jgi:hypothetical protein
VRLFDGCAGGTTQTFRHSGYQRQLPRFIELAEDLRTCHSLLLCELGFKLLCFVFSLCTLIPDPLWMTKTADKYQLNLRLETLEV